MLDRAIYVNILQELLIMYLISGS